MLIDNFRIFESINSTESPSLTGDSVVELFF